MLVVEVHRCLLTVLRCSSILEGVLRVDQWLKQLPASVRVNEIVFTGIFLLLLDILVDLSILGKSLEHFGLLGLLFFIFLVLYLFIRLELVRERIIRQRRCLKRLLVLVVLQV